MNQFSAASAAIRIRWRCWLRGGSLSASTTTRSTSPTRTIASVGDRLIAKLPTL